MNEDVCKFIDCYASATTDELNELIQAVQVHKHLSSCKSSDVVDFIIQTYQVTAPV